jgi:hypothetical protein
MSSMTKWLPFILADNFVLLPLVKPIQPKRLNDDGENEDQDNGSDDGQHDDHDEFKMIVIMPNVKDHDDD